MRQKTIRHISFLAAMLLLSCTVLFGCGKDRG